jgi:hypothetical protein
MDTPDDYHHGDQNISEQIHTYRMFDDLSKFGALFVGVLVIMLTLWFCLGVNFLGGLVPGLIILALGIWFLRRKPAAEH